MKLLKNKIVYEKINNLTGKAKEIIYPDSLEELKKIILMNKDIIPRGYGSSINAGVLPENSIIVDMSKNNRILELDINKKQVYVEAGITLKELNEQLEENNLEFPIETLFSGINTLGGAIALNTPSIRELKYNKTMNWVDMIEIIDSKGDLKKIKKADLSDYCGMEGTTGIILRAVLRLISKKQRTISILKSEDIEKILESTKKLRIDNDICSIELINKEISVLLGLENKYHLFIEFDNERGNFKNEDYRKFLKLKSKSYKKIAGEEYSKIESIKMFSENFRDFSSFLEKNKIPYISQIASGVFYCFFKPNQKQAIEEFEGIIKKLRGKQAYSFGIGLLKKSFLEKSDIELIKRAKMRTDPEFKFNNNKLIDLKKNSLAEEKIKEEKLEEKTENPTEQTETNPKINSEQTNETL